MNALYMFFIKINGILDVTAEFGEEIPAEEVGDTTSTAIKPIYDFMSTFGPGLIGILATVMALYAAILGFSYSKAENSDQRDSAKKKLVNGLIGFGVILILIIILYALREPISNLIDGN